MKIATAVETYVQAKRRSGYAFEAGQKSLATFATRVGNVDLSHITTGLVSSYLNESDCARVHWQMKYRLLLQFFTYWSDRDVISPLTMPARKPKPRPVFVPYIFSRLQLRQLLNTTLKYQDRRDFIDFQTMRTLILLVYGTGAFCGEILRLRSSDFDLIARTIRFREKGARSRVIPIGQSLKEVLAKYAKWRTKKNYCGSTFLVTKYDQPIRVATVAKHFERLRKASGILRCDDATFQPRVCDLRCTFAVHRISSWIRNGADLNLMLPALAAYMGQVGLGSTEKYLALTPARFQKHLDKLSPRRREFHWRDNSELMKFLSSL